MKWLILLAIFLVTSVGFSQEENAKQQQKATTASNNAIYEANQDIAENKFADAEANYRVAISRSGENTAAKYNLGNAYYRNEHLDEALNRYKQAGEIAQVKDSKHNAYHNMGNVFMKNKAYDKAVEAYKEALRNDPSDEETRYNLALAKEMLKKQQQDQKQDKKENQDKENQKNQDNQNQNDKNQDKGNQDQKNQDKENQESRDKNQDNKNQKNQDKGDQDQKNQDKGNQDKPDKDEKGNEKQKPGEPDKKDGQPKDEQGKQQPLPSQLSPQQLKNILEAVNNEERKVQEKVNAQKVKGVKTKTEKDW